MRRLLALLMIALPCAAGDLDNLVDADKLRLKSWLEPDSGIVVGQEVKLVIEIATPRWFAGGTRVKLPEIGQVVVLQRDGFATNFSRREGGDTWVLQQWRLELYPQREGRYRVPPVSIELAINDAEAGVVRGSLQTRAQVFEAGIPAVLQDIPVWLATPAFSADSTLDREPVALQPGDAFTRTIELQATSTAAMMLPEVTPHEVPGLAAYPELPELDNRSNRGEATAIRRQRITYVVERAGQYRLPEQTFYWWNTEQGRAERTSLAAVAIDAGSVPAATPGDIAARPWMLWAAAVVAAAAAATLLAAVFLWARRRGPASAPSEAELASRARRALRRGDAAAVASALYAWLNARAVKPGWLSLRNTVADLGDPEAVAATEKLLESAYGGREGGQSALGALRRALGSADRRRRKRGRQEMNLNPAQPRK